MPVWPLLLLAVGQSHLLAPRMEMFRDSSASMTAAEVLAPAHAAQWHPLPNARPNLGYTADVVWLRFTLAADSPVILDLGREWLEHVDLYVIDGAPVLLQRSGAAIAVSRRPVAAERIAFRFNESGRTYLVRVQSRSPISFLAELRPEREYWSAYALETLLMGGFYAVLLAMACYNALLFARLREPALAWLAAFILTYGLAEMASHGHLSRLLNTSGTELRGGALFFTCSIATSLAFQRIALLGSERRQTWRGMPKAALLTLPPASAMAVPFPELHAVVFVSLALMVVINLALCCRGIRSGNAVALRLALAQLALFAPGSVVVGTILGFGPVHPMTEHANHVGAVVMVVLLSLAVAEKIEGVRRAATRFVPRDFLAVLGRRDITEVRVGDARQVEMTVMFVDLRAFTAWAEHAAPGDVFARVNAWFARAVPVITRHGGFVDKFIGDAIMALFPSASAALSAAVELKRESSGAYSIGIGMHTGPMMLGTVGDGHRLDVSVIADSVNLASRIEGLTRHFGVEVLASQDTVVDAQRTKPMHGLVARWVSCVRVKGRSTPVDILEIAESSDSSPTLDAPRPHSATVVEMDSK